MVTEVANHPLVVVRDESTIVWMLLQLSPTGPLTSDAAARKIHAANDEDGFYSTIFDDAGIDLFIIMSGSISSL